MSDHLQSIDFITNAQLVFSLLKQNTSVASTTEPRALLKPESSISRIRSSVIRSRLWYEQQEDNIPNLNLLFAYLLLMTGVMITILEGASSSVAKPKIMSYTS
jgi:hypothetical protein